MIHTREAGLRLKSIRKEILNIRSGHSMAEQMGIPHGTYVHYELGSLEMGVTFLVKLYEKFGILPDYILIGKLPIKETPTKRRSALKEIDELKVQISILTSKIDRLIREK
jgi:transcriptional regulator with XRE-family HTH domain